MAALKDTWLPDGWRLVSIAVCMMCVSFRMSLSHQRMLTIERSPSGGGFRFLIQTTHA